MGTAMAPMRMMAKMPRGRSTLLWVLMPTRSPFFIPMSLQGGSHALDEIGRIGVS